MRLKLTIAYDGRPYGGWQIQPNADTIQERLEGALLEIAGTPIRVHGSGRTDAGVHALGQVAHFDAPASLSLNPANWVPALNTRLPATIRVMDCAEVPGDFHARFSAAGKTYTYRLSVAPVLPPLDAGLAWHVPRQLDPETLREVLALFEGTHDFRAFAASRGNETAETDYTRTLSECSLAAVPDGYLLTITGSGFLYKMVRLLTGAAVLCAQGRVLPAEVAALVESPGQAKSPLCAPPDGLSLREVRYETGG